MQTGTDEATEPETPPTEIQLETAFDLLSNRRRLLVIKYLSEHQEAELSGIAEHIAALESDIPQEDVEKKDRKRVFISLYQTHIPRLEEHGIVEYDSDEGVVTLTGEELLTQALRRVDPGTDRRWVRYYLGLTVLGWIGVGASVVLSSPGLEPAVIAPFALFLILLTILVAFQFLQTSARRSSTFRHLLE